MPIFVTMPKLDWVKIPLFHSQYHDSDGVEIKRTRHTAQNHMGKFARYCCLEELPFQFE